MRKHGALLGLALLAGCSAAGDDEASAAAPEDSQTANAPEGMEPIECAVDGGQWFLRECLVERAEDDGRAILVVWHKDGAFRRFEVLTDGRGLAVADGAEEAVTELFEGRRLDVSVGSDRYRFPATVRSDDGTE